MLATIVRNIIEQTTRSFIRIAPDKSCNAASGWADGGSVISFIGKAAFLPAFKKTKRIYTTATAYPNGKARNVMNMAKIADANAGARVRGIAHSPFFLLCVAANGRK
jgi:hypothetical protein